MKIFNIGNRIVNNYIIDTNKGYLVIDTGYVGNYVQFSKKLQKLNINKKDIRYIFITHVHDDHVGFLNELKNDTGATLIMHAESPDRLLAGHNQWIGGCSGRLAKFFVSAMSLAGKGKHEFPVMDVRAVENVVLWDRENQFFKQQGLPLTIVLLHGHTADNIGLLTDYGALFCGDAAMNGFPSVKRNIIWIENLDDYRKSWDAMIESPAKEIYPSHGKPFPKSDLIKYRKHLDKIRIY